MPKIDYVSRRFGDEALEVIARADVLCTQYAAQGYNLTLRQLYYQFVSRGWIPNTQQSYKRLGSIVNDARLAGLIDWDHITDRTRNLEELASWDDPEQIIDAVARQYRTHRWNSQPWYVEVWVEKEALADVVSRPADRWQVPYFSCRGYVSQSEMWAAARRMLRHERRGQKTVVIHLGDHDPSGIDMTRDIQDRLTLFGTGTEVNRIALTMDQVSQYNPPPNPAKLTDSRVEGYMELYGDESWELDALDPATLDDLIENTILLYLDAGDWAASTAQMERERRELTAASENWAAVVAEMDSNGWISDGDGEDES
jgi:hypothetical protein